MLPPIPDDVWQQPPETSLETTNLFNIVDEHSIETIQNTLMTESQHNVDVELQASLSKGTSPQKFGPNTELVQGDDKRSASVTLLRNSRNSQPEIHETAGGSTANSIGDDNIPPLTKLAPHVEETLLRNDDTNELYMPLSTTFLKRKKTDVVSPFAFRRWPSIRCPS